MTEQTGPDDQVEAPPSPTVALIDARLAVMTTGENSIGIQEVRLATLATELAAAEAHLEADLAEKARLEADRALLAPDPEAPIDPEETA